MRRGRAQANQSCIKSGAIVMRPSQCPSNQNRPHLGSPSPGRHITDRQMRLYITSRRKFSPTIAPVKAGYTTVATYRFEQTHELLSEKKTPHNRRQQDLFADIWESDFLPILTAWPDCALSLSLKSYCAAIRCLALAFAER